MKYRLTHVYTILIFLTLSSCKTSNEKVFQKEKLTIQKPNIIYIIADDLGYGDLSCLGQQKFKTPNIDRLASEGMLFTQHYSGATVCAPSRSALMTGLHTGHAPIRGNKEIQPEGQYPMPDSVLTLPKILQANGYKTGGFGKWGLGFPGSEGDPNNQGFDYFYGYNCQRIGHNYYPFHMWENDQKIILEENKGDGEGVYGPNLIHEKTLDFIEQNKDQPFFAYVPSIIPHAELKVPEKYISKYRGQLEPEKSHDGCDPGCKDYKIGGYGSQPDAHAAFAGMVELLDQQVGEIVAKVKELGLEENTLIIFTSDNGPHKEGGADPDYFDSNGIYKGYKRDLYEGGIKVPMIARWHGKIIANTKSEHVSAFWDVLPTIAELAGVASPDGIDGISFVPTLLGKGEQGNHDYLYWEFHEKGGRRAIRKGKWKLVQYNVGNPELSTLELFDLENDPSESTDLSQEKQDLFEELKQILMNARTSSEVFQFADEQFKG